MPPAFRDEIIQEFEQGLAEFKGTEEELFLVQEFLALLRTEKLYHRWMQVYLEALGSHPTDVRIGQLAAEAKEVAQALGREQDLLAIFRQLSRMPFDFPAKPWIQAAVPEHASGS